MIQVYAAVLKFDGKYLMTTRPFGKHLAGQWEFPGGKIEVGETPGESIVREIHEELHLSILPLDMIYRIEYQYPEKKVVLNFCRVVLRKGASFMPIPKEGQKYRWLFPEEMLDLDIVPADFPVINFLQNIGGY